MQCMLKQAIVCYVIAMQDSAKISGILSENGRLSLQNRGIVDILYDGFRKCFVNCKFTFYITLSSYYKKVKISKIRKRHSKM